MLLYIQAPKKKSQIISLNIFFLHHLLGLSNHRRVFLSRLTVPSPIYQSNTQPISINFYPPRQTSPSVRSDSRGEHHQNITKTPASTKEQRKLPGPKASWGPTLSPSTVKLSLRSSFLFLDTVAHTSGYRLLFFHVHDGKSYHFLLG